MKKNALNYLAWTFAASGLWDTVAGFLFIFAIGTGRSIDNPPTHPFYAIFLGSFFLCFAYLQFLSAFNITLISDEVRLRDLFVPYRSDS